MEESVAAASFSGLLSLNMLAGRRIMEDSLLLRVGVGDLERREVGGNRVLLFGLLSVVFTTPCTTTKVPGGGKWRGAGSIGGDVRIGGAGGGSSSAISSATGSAGCSSSSGVAGRDTATAGGSTAASTMGSISRSRSFPLASSVGLTLDQRLDVRHRLRVVTSPSDIPDEADPNILLRRDCDA